MMESKTRGRGLAAGLALALTLGAGAAQATMVTPLDLNDFSFFTGDPVTIEADGSSATISESAVISPILLFNDPPAQSEIIVAIAGRLLVFDYRFVEPAGNDDSFVAELLDSSGIASLPLGAPYTFSTDSASSGTISFDIGGLVGTTLGLQFGLFANPGETGLDSTVTISNLRLVDPMMAPEPATLALLAASCLAAGLRRRRRAVPGVSTC